MNDRPVYWQPGMKLDDVEKLVLIAALQYCQGNKTKTAAALGISIPTVRAKISQYDIAMPGMELEKDQKAAHLPAPKMQAVQCLACGRRFEALPDEAYAKCPNGHTVGHRAVL